MAQEWDFAHLINLILLNFFCILLIKRQYLTISKNESNILLCFGFTLCWLPFFFFSILSHFLSYYLPIPMLNKVNHIILRFYYTLFWKNFLRLLFYHYYFYYNNLGAWTTCKKNSPKQIWWRLTPDDNVLETSRNSQTTVTRFSSDPLQHESCLVPV